MKKLLKILIVLGVLGAGAAFGVSYLRAYWKDRNRPNYREAAVTRGEIVAVVNSTGTVQPVLKVQVGAFVSGPIEKLYVDFNQKVKKDQVLAKIDPRIYKAAVARDEATLATRNAEVARAQAQLQQAMNDERRAKNLRAEHRNALSETEMDQLTFNRKSLEAQLVVAQASVKQAQATLDNSKIELAYTEVKSPVDGVVIDRKIDEGQTLVAQFQTPELFVVAPDLEKLMHVFASVDEADIGLIREAQKRKQKVEFTVDAYPDEIFEGPIHQIRMNPTTVQNVVTYSVVVECPNPSLKLLPGMTANLSFQLDRRASALRIPNAALRFYPKVEMVHPDDRKIFEATETEAPSKDQEDAAKEAEGRSAQQRFQAGKGRNRRHVWVRDGDLLRAVEVTTGISDNKSTELLSGQVQDGQMLVIGTQTGPAAK